MEIANYQIIKKIGKGGMSVVYLAKDQSGHQLALKVLTIHHDRDKFNILIKRFQNEAELIKRLDHSHIIHIKDSGISQSFYYIAMDYINGPTLKTIIKNKPLNPSKALHYLKQITSGLSYAHEHGIIHRDIKAANILIGPHDHSVITDFGIAKALEETSQDLTQTGHIVGTPYYMSPEQILGQGLDARSDLYSLGILFYQMLMGTLPFQGKEVVTIIKQHVDSPIPQLSDSLYEYQPIINALLQKNPKNRPQVAAELLTLLTHYDIPQSPHLSASSFSKMDFISIVPPDATQIAYTHQTSYTDNIAQTNSNLSDLKSKKTFDHSGINLFQKFSKLLGWKKYYTYFAIISFLIISGSKLIYDYRITDYFELKSQIVSIPIHTNELIHQKQKILKQLRKGYLFSPPKNNIFESLMDIIKIESIEAIPKELWISLFLTPIEDQLISQEDNFDFSHLKWLNSLPSNDYWNAIKSESFLKIGTILINQSMDHLNLSIDFFQSSLEIYSKEEIPYFIQINIDEVFKKNEAKLKLYLSKRTQYKDIQVLILFLENNLLEATKIRINSLINKLQNNISDFLAGPMISLQGTCFNMGKENYTFTDERPANICLSSFKIAQYETTWRLYQIYIKEMNIQYDIPQHLLDYPVTNVSYHQAQSYVRWLSQKTGKHFQLPTEAQWEYAARAFSTTDYYWGKQFKPYQAHCLDCNQQIPSFFTQKVGNYNTNDFLLYDILGNVSEWTCSDYHPKLQNDYANVCSHNEKPKVYRGGSWHSNSYNLRLNKRFFTHPNNTSDDLGFRIVKLNSPQQVTKKEALTGAQ